MTQQPTTGQYARFVGIDIAATTFTASWLTLPTAETPPVTLSQTPDGFAALQRQLQATGIPPAATLVVLEATSTYWVALAVTLHDAGYFVSVVNPAQVYNYARSLPRRAKTDRLDAQLLTQFAAERHPARWTPPPAVYHDLRQRLVARDALISMRTQARNHRHALIQWPVVVDTVKAQLDDVITDLDTRIDTLAHEIEQVLHDSAWAEAAELLETITGIGTLTAATMLVTTLNFRLCPTAEAAAAFAGLAPMVRESGSSVRGRPRVGHAGNARLRTALYNGHTGSQPA